MSQRLSGNYALGAFVLFILAPLTALAGDVSVAPILIDEDTEARGIITQDISITNNTDRKLDVYATVNEISVDSTGQIKEFVTPVMTDRTNTVTSWIEITRGQIELDPHTATSVPLTIHVNPFAKPGEYHAFVGFFPASKRYEAENAAMAGDAEGTIVKVSIKQKTNELLRIRGFFIDRFIVGKKNQAIDIEVENSGDNEVIPKGEVIFYNSLGEETSSIQVNTENIAVPPGEKRTIKSQVPFHSEMGRFKANVKLSYGDNQQAAVFDTAQFFMIPLPIMVGIIIAILFFSLMVTYLIRRAFHDELHRDDDNNEIPLYIRNDRDHHVKEHDIHITKSE